MQLWRSVLVSVARTTLCSKSRVGDMITVLRGRGDKILAAHIRLHLSSLYTRAELNIVAQLYGKWSVCRK